MGDRAGIVGYLLEDGVLQMEGLEEDRALLRDIAAQRNLVEVLQERDVEYYVATNPGRQNGCYEWCEPAQAGPSAPHMRASWCHEPVFRFQVGGVVTMVFRLLR
jgi:hypothetical protein